jgi:dipeptidyl aminopeptidase/acylaminoacyl peptidase
MFCNNAWKYSVFQEISGMKSLILFASLFAFVTVFAQPDGTILSRTPVSFPSYSAVQDISWYYSEGEYQAAISDKKVSFEKLTYSSDGLKVIAYFVTPAEKSTEKYPVIIFNRGSYIRNDIAFVHAPLFYMFVNSGFIVIAPALRGSEGGEGKDELGGSDIADLMNISKVLTNLTNADTENVFMLGESRGGMMTFQAIKNRFPMRAAATVGAITDLSTYVNDQRWEEKTLISLWSDYSLNKAEILEQRSVLRWSDAIDIPILILHGAKDPQVKPEHALRFAQHLSNAGKTYQLMILAEGNHILSGPCARERDRQVVDWFQKHHKK